MKRIVSTFAAGMLLVSFAAAAQQTGKPPANLGVHLTLPSQTKAQPHTPAPSWYVDKAGKIIVPHPMEAQRPK
jgi:hypothetical protein